jgi:hypothetical protein
MPILESTHREIAPCIGEDEIMNTRPLLVLVGASLLAGCAYYPQGGYSTPGYAYASPYYHGYQTTYQTTYQPAYQTTYQPAYQTTYQGNTYRPAPNAYPLYSPSFSPPDTNGGGQ